MFEFASEINQLHFIRPWAWLLLIPIIILWWLYRTRGQQASGWAKLIDQHLLSWLMPKSELGKSIKWQKNLLLACWVLMIIALSGPSWNKLPQPVFSNLASRVIVLDLSSSMDAQDVKPSRLARAKFKIADLLQAIKDGQTGFVVYAGDGFILSPLTTDTDTINNMVGVLSTNLMPLVGTYPSKGIERGVELLNNGSAGTGDIIWITDGARSSELSKIKSLMSNTPYNLNILAIGTAEGSPIPMPNSSGFVKDNNGNIVIPKLDYRELADFAEDIDATLTPMTADSDDIDLLLQQEQLTFDEKLEKQDVLADSWEDAGFWLLFLTLPILLLGFKHRSMFGIVFVITFGAVTASPELQANPLETIFLNKDQQAKKLLNKEQFEEAYKTFEDPQWKAVAAYRKGDYKAAEDYFLDGKQLTPADQLYNKANAQALSGDLKTALESYNKALALNSKHSDAQHNKKIIEDLLKQQQEQEQKQQQDESSESQQEQSNQQQQQKQNQDDSSQSNENSEEQQETSEQQQQKPELTEEELQQQFKEEEKDQELEQWLKRLPDDPGGLLRRKMYQEYRKRGHNQHVDETW